MQDRPNLCDLVADMVLTGSVSSVGQELRTLVEQQWPGYLLYHDPTIVAVFLYGWWSEAKPFYVLRAHQAWPLLVECLLALQSGNSDEALARLEPVAKLVYRTDPNVRDMLQHRSDLLGEADRRFGPPAPVTLEREDFGTYYYAFSAVQALGWLEWYGDVAPKSNLIPLDSTVYPRDAARLLAARFFETCEPYHRAEGGGIVVLTCDDPYMLELQLAAREAARMAKSADRDELYRCFVQARRQRGEQIDVERNLVRTQLMLNLESGATLEDTARALFSQGKVSYPASHLRTIQENFARTLRHHLKALERDGYCVPDTARPNKSGKSGKPSK